MEEVVISKFSEKGRGIAEKDGKKWEVFSAFPGDRVQIETIGKKRGAKLGVVREVLEPSLSRVAPRCCHAFSCGGCSLQGFDYLSQLKEKEARVKAYFSALLDGIKFHPILPSPKIWEYRNKMEFSFSQNRAGEKFLGLMLAGSKNKVIRLEECHLGSVWFQRAIKEVQKWWDQSTAGAYRFNDTGALRHICLRASERTSDKMAILTVSGNPLYALSKGDIEGYKNALLNSVEDPSRLSIFVRVQQMIKGQPTQFFEMHLHGPDHMMETLMLDERLFQFKISPASFFQPNTLQAENLYSHAIKIAGVNKQSVVFDLYCGAAAIGLILAPHVKKVIGIELNHYAVIDGRANAELNRIDNLELILGDVAEKLALMMQEPGFIRPDLAIVDPTRTGLGKAVKCLLELSPEKILYISCNPKTQALDIGELVNNGYRLKEMQPVDQFPHTMHIENIALLER